MIRVMASPPALPPALPPHLDVMQSASTMVEDKALIILVIASRRFGLSVQEMVILDRASSGLSQSEGCTSTVALGEGGREGGREGEREG